MRLLLLAEVCRKAGLTVVEVDGWRYRGVEFTATPRIVVWHHTATPASAAGDYPSLRIVRDGRNDLPGPLSQLGLGRSGTVYVIAAGKANHAGAGAWDGITLSSSTIGIEAESPGDGTWTAAQRAAYPRLAAALTRMLGTTARRNCGHREWALPAGRKPDPTGIDMNAMRTRVASLLSGTVESHVPGSRMLRVTDPLMRGEDVAVAARWAGLIVSGVDALYGGVTAAAVKAKQAALGLPADGVVGPQTWTVILATPAPSYSTALNTEGPRHDHVLASGRRLPDGRRSSVRQRAPAGGRRRLQGRRRATRAGDVPVRALHGRRHVPDVRRIEMTSTVIETKVALPAVVVACAAVLCGALYTLARAYGFEPTDTQDKALLGLGAAVQYVLYVLVGYFAPHTDRPDL